MRRDTTPENHAKVYRLSPVAWICITLVAALAIAAAVVILLGE